MPTITWNGETVTFGSAASPGLWYDGTRPTSERMMFAHDFGPFPDSIDNAQPDVDYYARNYLKAAGESGSHAAVDGFLRNRPIGRPTIPGDWRAADATTDIRQAVAGGMDGFLCDIMGTSGGPWNTYIAHMNAASQLYPDGSFKVVPMLDVGGFVVTTASTDQAADAIFAFSQAKSSWYLPDGRYVVSSFRAEAKDPTWWDALFANLKARHGLSAAFMPAYLDVSQAPRFAGFPWSFGTGWWGDGADPVTQTAAGNKTAGIKARGEKVMFPVQGQNVRPAAKLYEEAYGTQAFRVAFERLIAENADFMQLVTFNDYSEGGEVGISVANSTVWLDLAGWYAHKWKTGAFPEILLDTVILSHRNQLTTAKTTGTQTAKMQQWARASRSTPQDVVEVLTFLTAPADVTVTVGGVDTTFSAPAGQSVKYLPLRAGAAPAAKITRAGVITAQIVSPAAVLVSPVKQDMQYFRSSSARGTAGQFDPQVKYGY